MHVNDYVLPSPGSLVTPVVQGSVPDPTYIVIASQQIMFPGNWGQYKITVLGANRLRLISMQKDEFHENWHVLHRP